MGFIVGLIKRLIRIFIYFVILAAIIAFIPNLPPYTSFTKIDLEPTLPLVGPLAPNNDLNNVQKLYADKLLGPECFQLHKGEVYTSLATGEIVKLSPGGHVTFVTQIGKPCSGIRQEHVCGRPLGFAIDEKKNLMYVADAYYGIWSVNLDTNKKTQLVSPNVEIDGLKPRFFNSVTFDSKGNVYYTDSNTDFPLQDGAFSMLTDPSGRLIQYNPATKQNKVLLDKLWFANGVVVSPNEDFIVVTETSALRLQKYYLSGPKKGQKELFIGGLPGYPDNLRALPDGSGLQAALYSVFEAGEPVLARTLAAAPLARKVIVRAQVLVQTAFEFLHKHFPQPIFEDIIYSIGHFTSLAGLLPNGSGVVHLDWNGNIKNAYFQSEGQQISDAIYYNGKVYLGQPHRQNFIAAVAAPVSFKKAFTPIAQEKPQVKKEAPPPQATPKPAPPKVEPAKPAPTPSPVKVVKKTEAPKTTPPPPTPKPTQTPPKATTQPPKQPPTQAQQPPKQAQEPPKQAQQPPKQAPKTTPPPAPTTTPKPVEKKTPPPPPPAKPVPQDKPKDQKQQQKPTTTPPPKPSAKPTEQKQAKPDVPNAKAPKEIPIREDIPSDTVKPNKETLKVINKAGPTEIPNPEL